MEQTYKEEGQNQQTGHKNYQSPTTKEFLRRGSHTKDLKGKTESITKLPMLLTRTVVYFGLKLKKCSSLVFIINFHMLELIMGTVYFQPITVFPQLYVKADHDTITTSLTDLLLTCSA